MISSAPRRPSRRCASMSSSCAHQRARQRPLACRPALRTAVQKAFASGDRSAGHGHSASVSRYMTSSSACLARRSSGDSRGTPRARSGAGRRFLRSSGPALCTRSRSPTAAIASLQRGPARGQSRTRVAEGQALLAARGRLVLRHGTLRALLRGPPSGPAGRCSRAPHPSQGGLPPRVAPVASRERVLSSYGHTSRQAGRGRGRSPGPTACGTWRCPPPTSPRTGRTRRRRSTARAAVSTAGGLAPPCCAPHACSGAMYERVPQCWKCFWPGAMSAHRPRSVRRM